MVAVVSETVVGQGADVPRGDGERVGGPGAALDGAIKPPASSGGGGGRGGVGELFGLAARVPGGAEAEGQALTAGSGGGVGTLVDDQRAVSGGARRLVGVCGRRRDESPLENTASVGHTSCEPMK